MPKTVSESPTRIEPSRSDLDELVVCESDRAAFDLFREARLLASLRVQWDQMIARAEGGK